MNITVTAYHDEAISMYGYYPSVKFDHSMFKTSEEFYEHCLRSLSAIFPDLDEEDVLVTEIGNQSIETQGVPNSWDSIKVLW